MDILTDASAKQQIIEIGKRMYGKNFVAANDGNISCRVDENYIWCTPTGVSKGFMTEDMLVKMDLDGNIIAGSMGSTEIKMHLRIYQENPETRGITHAHPPISTAFAIAGIPLNQGIYPEALVNLGTVPVVHYATPGTEAVADSIAPYCLDYKAVLLANHGALTWGKSLMEAWYAMESLEHYAQIIMYTSKIIGQANFLSNEQITDLIKIRQSLGNMSMNVPQGVKDATNNKDIL